MRLLLALSLFALAPAFAADNDPWKLDDKFKSLKDDDLKDAKGTPCSKAPSCSSTARTLRTGPRPTVRMK